MSSTVCTAWRSRLTVTSTVNIGSAPVHGVLLCKVNAVAGMCSTTCRLKAACWHVWMLTNPAKAAHGDSKQGKLAVVQGSPSGGKGHACLLRPCWY